MENERKVLNLMKEKICIYTYCKINKRDLIIYQKPK